MRHSDPVESGLLSSGRPVRRGVELNRTTRFRMESKRPHSLNRVLSVGCFVLASIFAAPAVWLCVRGEIPPHPAG